MAKSPKSPTGRRESGRRNPPKHMRFRPGQSGNPKGRPKGSKNLRTIITEAANHPVVATIDGKRRRISKLQATAMQLATKAAGGNQAAINKLLDWIDEMETRAAAARPSQYPFSDADKEVLDAIHDRMMKADPTWPGV